MTVIGPDRTDHLGIDCRRWTNTKARREAVYQSREFYEYARGESSLASFLKDTKRFLFVTFELCVSDTATGNKERRLFPVPGVWLQDQFAYTTGVKIDDIANRWPSFGKDDNLLYKIDICELLAIADRYQDVRRS